MNIESVFIQTVVLLKYTDRRAEVNSRLNYTSNS
jgi:hypothetical protein